MGGFLLLRRYFSSGIISSNLKGKVLVKKVNRNSCLDMPDLLKKQIQENHQINMFPLHEYWLDIGRIDEYQRANEEIKYLKI